MLSESGRGIRVAPEGFSEAVFQRATERVGHVAYAMLRSVCFAAGPALGGLLSVPMREFQALRAEHGDRQEVVRAVGEAFHWEAIARVDNVAETLLATLTGLKAYRAGSRSPAEKMLRFSGNLVDELHRPDYETPDDWLAILSPIRSDPSAGLTKTESRLLARAFTSTATYAADAFSSLKSFYTRDAHRVYIRHKHGYTLLSPWASAWLFDLPPGAPDLRAEIAAALEGGFVVLEKESATAPTRAIAVSSTEDDLRVAVEVALSTLQLLVITSTMWLLEAEHPLARSLPVIVPDSSERTASVISKWFGFAVSPQMSPETVSSLLHSAFS